MVAAEEEDRHCRHSMDIEPAAVRAELVYRDLRTRLADCRIAGVTVGQVRAVVVDLASHMCRSHLLGPEQAEGVLRSHSCLVGKGRLYLKIGKAVGWAGPAHHTALSGRHSSTTIAAEEAARRRTMFAAGPVVAAILPGRRIHTAFETRRHHTAVAGAADRIDLGHVG